VRSCSYNKCINLTFNTFIYTHWSVLVVKHLRRGEVKVRLVNYTNYSRYVVCSGPLFVDGSVRPIRGSPTSPTRVLLLALISIFPSSQDLSTIATQHLPFTRSFIRFALRFTSGHCITVRLSSVSLPADAPNG
jgi:hypothetical protein